MSEQYDPAGPTRLREIEEKYKTFTRNLSAKLSYLERLYAKPTPAAQVEFDRILRGCFDRNGMVTRALRELEKDSK